MQETSFRIAAALAMVASLLAACTLPNPFERSAKPETPAERSPSPMPDQAAEVAQLRQANRIIDTQLQRARAELEKAHAEAELRGFLVIGMLDLLRQVSTPAEPS